jgi:hypothetical protein
VAIDPQFSPSEDLVPPGKRVDQALHRVGSSSVIRLAPVNRKVWVDGNSGSAEIPLGRAAVLQWRSDDKLVTEWQVLDVVPPALAIPPPELEHAPIPVEDEDDVEKHQAGIGKNARLAIGLGTMALGGLGLAWAKVEKDNFWHADSWSDAHAAIGRNTAAGVGGYSLIIIGAGVSLSAAF